MTDNSQIKEKGLFNRFRTSKPVLIVGGVFSAFSLGLFVFDVSEVADYLGVFPSVDREKTQIEMMNFSNKNGDHVYFEVNIEFWLKNFPVNGLQAELTILAQDANWHFELGNEENYMLETLVGSSKEGAARIWVRDDEYTGSVDQTFLICVSHQMKGILSSLYAHQLWAVVTDTPSSEERHREDERNRLLEAELGVGVVSASVIGVDTNFVSSGLSFSSGNCEKQTVEDRAKENGVVVNFGQPIASG